MDARLDMCKQKGFDMVELDNVDGYSNKTGFPLTAADQLYFNDTLANDAHVRGLSVLQKNDVEQTASLLPYFDGTLNEQCNQYSECSALSAYVSAGKPVFNALGCQGKGALRGAPPDEYTLQALLLSALAWHGVRAAGADFSLQVLPEHFERGVQLLADNQLSPALPEDDFKIIQ